MRVLLVSHDFLPRHPMGTEVYTWQLGKALQARGCSRGETLVYRALLDDILDRAYSPAYRHAARYLTRLAAIARTDVDLAPLTSHADFELDLRLRHKRKLGFWGAVERAG